MTSSKPLAVFDAINLVDETLVGELRGEGREQVQGAIQEDHGVELRRDVLHRRAGAEQLLTHALQQVCHHLGESRSGGGEKRREGKLKGEGYNVW